MSKKSKKPATAKKKATSKKSAPKGLANIEQYKKKLLELEDDLKRIVTKKKEEEVLPEVEVGDEADVAVRSVERDLSFEQTGNELHMLEEVEAALRRIEKGSYGICEGNGERITLARLKYVPYARYCIKCQARFESR